MSSVGPHPRSDGPAPHSVNVSCGQAERRVLLTGLHAVADIFCECCKTNLGWKYVSAGECYLSRLCYQPRLEMCQCRGVLP